jgi:hypothetical protein
MATLPRRLACCALVARVAILAILAILALLVPALALADEPAAVAPEAPPPVAKEEAPKPNARRGGFVLGLALGAGVSSIVGYPNDLQKEGYAGYYTATGARPSALGQLWIGAAFSDWLTFGIGATGNTLYATGSDKARSFAGLFHVEAFPLYPLGGHLRDLGVMLDAGFGTATVTDAMSDKLVDSSAASLVGGGVFYEAFRTWKIRQGPFLMGNYVWSDTAIRPGIFAGWRASLYAKP